MTIITMMPEDTTMTTKIDVYHKDQFGFVRVAAVEVPDDVEDKLEYAWRWTNNIEGSWSLKEVWDTFTSEPNPDFNENVTVFEPLKQMKGRKLGHRSSMTGDVFVMDGKKFEVGFFGYKDFEGELK